MYSKIQQLWEAGRSQIRTALIDISGATIGAGLHMAAKFAADDPIEPEEIVQTALETGADAGIKSAAAGAIKVAAEKCLIGIIPPGTPMGGDCKHCLHCG